MTTTTRTKRELRIAAVAAVLTGAAVQIAGAQEPAAPVSVDVSECVKLTTPEARLACFDKQVEGSRTAAPSAPAASSSPPPANNSSSGTGRQPQADPPDIHASITGLRETVPNSYLVTLDNGQVWRQTVPKSYPLREGDRVRLYYSRWRAYRLTNERLKGFIQVERVQ